jgi:hypothetical protein
MSSGSLKFSLTWKEARDNGECLTTACLVVLIDGEPIWPVEGDPQVNLEVQADDLLSHLAEFWKPLVLRQTYPIAVAPDRPLWLRPEAERRWGTQPKDVVELEDGLICAFEEAQDLSRCFAGMFDLPPLWILRAGEKMIVDTRAKPRVVDFEVAERGLSEVGDEIASRLGDSQPQRWGRLIDAWRARDRGDPAVLLAWSASLDREVARAFVSDGTLSPPETVREAASDNDELRIAARMASALPAEQIRQIVSIVRGFSKSSAPQLDALADRTKNYIDQNFENRRAHEQGEAAGGFIRDNLSLLLGEWVDIFSIVEALGISVHIKPVEPATLDGLAAWGSKHGPAVLLNAGSQRIRMRGDLRRNAVARVTLAHEFCHLLLDRGHALSAVDVLNSRMPQDVERRSKAFAGELLLPSRIAADIWIHSGSPRNVFPLKNFLINLGRRFGVPQSVAAWKLEHGLHAHNIDIRHVLDLAVPYR